MKINARELKLITESLERMDPDTLNDDLISEGYEETSGEELDELVRRIRHDYQNDE